MPWMPDSHDVGRWILRELRESFDMGTSTSPPQIPPSLFVRSCVKRFLSRNEWRLLSSSSSNEFHPSKPPYSIGSAPRKHFQLFRC